MDPSQSITRCIELLKRGDRVAADQLWDSYIHRLVELARKKLRAIPRPIADEEDVALSAFDSFYRRAEGGQFARLSDRNDLWQILVIITERKAIDLVRREGRLSRGGGRLHSLDTDPEGEAASVIDAGPTPEFAAEVADECRKLLESLGDDSLRKVAISKMEGYTNRQIAEQLGCIEQTVERKLRSIRRIWTDGRDS